MNTKLFSIFGFIVFFPIWAFRANLSLIQLFIILGIFFIIPFIIHLYFFKFIKAKNDKLSIFSLIYLSLLIVFCLDQNLGLWTISLKFVSNISLMFNFNIYSDFLKAACFLILIFMLSTLFLNIINHNGFKILFVFLISITFFNALNYKKNLSSFLKIDLVENLQNIKFNDDKKTLILILDEMSGINSEDSDHYSGLKAKNALIEIFQKNQFELYVNAKPLYNGTRKSIPSLMNFITTKDQYEKKIKSVDKKYALIQNSNNYFVTNDLLRNKFFDNEKFKNIIVYQSMFLNFCRNKKVIKCHQYNPFSKPKIFLKGFKDSNLTSIISAFKNNSSIIGNITWRLLRHFNFIDSLLDPEGEKATFQDILDNIAASLSSKKSNLLFAHILVPHVPYGFDENCNYDGLRGTKYNSMTIDEKKIQHNLERFCVSRYLDSFFLKLKQQNMWKNLEITILSDHDSRIDKKDDLLHTAIFAHKSILNLNKEKFNYLPLTINKIFNDLYNN